MKNGSLLRTSSAIGLAAVAGVSGLIQQNPSVFKRAPDSFSNFSLNAKPSTSTLNYTGLSGNRSESSPGLRSVVDNRSTMSYTTSISDRELQRMSRETVALEDFSEVLSSLQGEGSTEPRTEVIECVKDIIAMIGEHAETTPSIDHDGEGGIEIFLKDKNNALMIAIDNKMTIGIYGDSRVEKWRARYEIEGRAWKRHIPDFLGELSIA